MKQRVFGSYRTLGDDLLAQAGAAAEGFEAVFPYDPTRTDPKWIGFEQRYAAQFQEKPEQFAALAYRRDECAAGVDMQGGAEPCADP